MTDPNSVNARAGAGRQGSYAALALHETDNVATAVQDLVAGDEVRVMWSDGQTRAVTVSEDVPFGHKFSLEEMAAGAEVRKYGERIGKTRQHIARGQHVHVHNVESERGRGDLAADDEDGQAARDGRAARAAPPIAEEQGS